MNKFVLKIDNIFFEIEKISNTEMEISVVKDPLEKIYTNIPLLYSDTTGENSAFLVFDENEDDEIIENAGTNLLGTKSYFCKIKKIGNQKIAWYAKKTEIINLFKEFTFSKIIPLDIVLLKMKKDLAGIVTDNFIYLRRFKDLFSLTSKDTLIFDLNSNFNLFLGICEDILEIDKKIITDKIVDKEIKEQYNFETATWKEIERLIENEKTFIILDKYSGNYQSKVYRILLLTSSAVMISFSPYLLWKFYQHKTETAYYNHLIQKEQNLLSYIQHQEKKYTIDLLYKWYNPIKFSNFYKRISSITLNPGIISVKYTEKPINNNKVLSTYSIIIDNLTDFKKFLNKNKKNITYFKINPTNEQVKVKLVVTNNIKK